MTPPAPDTYLSFAERDTATAELFTRLASAGTPEESERMVEQIVHLYLGLCSSMAGRYSGRGIEFEDLVQVARLALVKAVRRYEPGRGPSFAAYAVPTISGELKRCFRDCGWVVRPPRRLQELIANIQSVRAQLEQQLGASPSDADLAEAAGATVEEVREVGSAGTGFHALPLEGGPADDDRPGLAAFLATRDEQLDSADDRVSLTAALSQLAEGEREMQRMRYGEGMTQREIAAARGVSQMQVSRALRRILLRLHDHLVGNPLASAERTTPPERPSPAPAVAVGRAPALRAGTPPRRATRRGTRTNHAMGADSGKGSTLEPQTIPLRAAHTLVQKNT